VTTSRGWSATPASSFEVQAPGHDGLRGSGCLELHPHLVVAEHAQRQHPGPVAHLPAAGDGGRLQRGDGAVGVQASGIRGDEYPRVEPQARPASPRLLGRQELRADARRPESRVHGIERGVVAVVDDARGLEQRFAGLALEGAPERGGLGEHGDIRRVGVGLVEVA
jgi:hypothetical protein